MIGNEQNTPIEEVAVDIIQQESVLVMVLAQVDRLPEEAFPALQAGKGYGRIYPERLFVKAALVMLVQHWPKVQEFYEALQQPVGAMQRLRELLSVHGRFPSRRTFNRRVKAVAESLPTVIGWMGRMLVEQMRLWEQSGRAVALDSSVLRASGVVWHQKQRKKGEVPVTSIDTEAHWTKSGWHGWVYGWKLHLASGVGAGWLPVAAELTAANVPDDQVAPRLLAHVPEQTRFVLGDKHYNRESLRSTCEQQQRILVATRYGKYPHTDEGVEVRRIFHHLRSRANENLNEHFKGIFGVHGAVPTKGLAATTRFALGAVLLYQVAIWMRFEQGVNPWVGLKAFLKAA